MPRDIDFLVLYKRAGGAVSVILKDLQNLFTPVKVVVAQHDFPLCFICEFQETTVLGTGISSSTLYRD